MGRRGEVVQIFYDPDKLDWHELAKREMRSRGLRYCDIRIILCYPENLRSDFKPRKEKYDNDGKIKKDS